MLNYVLRISDFFFWFVTKHVKQIALSTLVWLVQLKCEFAKNPLVLFLSDVHESSFIAFMACSMLFMLLWCILFRLSASRPMTNEVY